MISIIVLPIFGKIRQITCWNFYQLSKETHTSVPSDWVCCQHVASVDSGFTILLTPMAPVYMKRCIGWFISSLISESWSRLPHDVAHMNQTKSDFWLWHSMLECLWHRTFHKVEITSWNFRGHFCYVQDDLQGKHGRYSIIFTIYLWTKPPSIQRSVYDKKETKIALKNQTLFF